MINRRIGMLAPECARLLESAAVLGQECDLDVLSSVVGQPVEKTAQLADEAVTARLLDFSGDPHSGVRFGHALVRQTLYAGLSAGRRAELHARAADAIEQCRSGELDSRLGELANHLWQAGIDPVRAADYATRAGHHALTMLAYEEAVHHFARAVQIMEATDPPAVEARCRLTLLLGRAQYLAANMGEARETYRSAAELAEQIGAAELLAETALAIDVDYTFGVRDELEIQLLESALRHLPEQQQALRARVLARLARALLFTPDLPHRIRLSEQAVALARRSAHATALAAS